ncbi:MAG: class I SAM-dependent methyltransferase [Actinobacteria bacterium]|nr:class I SAM-dependent methyltransferase [Actinomycetota bacterium]
MEGSATGDDRERWNVRYEQLDAASDVLSPHLSRFEDRLPRDGRALDVAGGAGRHAVWLAARGLQVTVCDVSDAGLRLAQQRASKAGLAITTVQGDLTVELLPSGPWDLVLCAYYLQRDLWPDMREALAPGGWLVLIHPTTRNLERHERPGPRFLLEPGEAVGVAEGLQLVHHEEAWSDADRHEAVVVARRPRRASAPPRRRLRSG